MFLLVLLALFSEDFAKNAFRMHSSPNRRSKIQELRRSLVQKGQDSRFKIPKRILESKGVGFKIQDSRLRKNFLNPRR
jgi:hypothetical protein